jgi:hypothetical protein
VQCVSKQIITDFTQRQALTVAAAWFMQVTTKVEHIRGLYQFKEVEEKEKEKEDSDEDMRAGVLKNCHAQRQGIRRVCG